MLQNIKSSYIADFIFSKIEIGKKLKMVRYNKELQKKLNLKLLHYMLFSGKYIIFEKDGMVKEYFSYNDNLIYEGEYKNGKRNGKGKEYFEYSSDFLNELIFEGEYIDGKRNGICKEYYFKSGQLKFEGEYLKGKKWNGKGYDYSGKIIYQLTNGEGYIKEYNDYKSLEFEGEFVNGERNGKGKEYSSTISNVVEFEGEYLNGKRNGEGKEYNYKSELIFKGEYKDGKRWNGVGFIPGNKNIAYELKNGKGYVKELYYEGEYVNGERNGKGQIFSQGKILTWEVEYVNGKKNGRGKIFYRDGTVRFDGLFFNDYKLKGKEYKEGKLVYEGEYFFYRKWDGKGYDENGKVIYELKNGNGTVKEYSGNCLTFDGNYLNGRKNGKCKEYYIDEKEVMLKFDGEYLEGKMNGYCKLYYYGDKNYLQFEGEFLNEYNYFGKLISKGEYKNGELVKKEKCQII